RARNRDGWGGYGDRVRRLDPRAPPGGVLPADADLKLRPNVRQRRLIGGARGDRGRRARNLVPLVLRAGNRAAGPCPEVDRLLFLYPAGACDRWRYGVRWDSAGGRRVGREHDPAAARTVDRFEAHPP